MLKSSNINIMSNALLKASRLLRRDFNELENLQNSLSRIQIFVSRSLQNVKEILFEELNKARPEWEIIFKEDEKKGYISISKENSKLLVKPISGIYNYAKGISYFTTSVTLIEQNIQNAVVVYDPIKDELFCAERGKGAFLNNFRIRISSNKNLNNSIVVIESSELLVEKIRVALEKKNAIIRIFGSKCLDFANLASGRIDCYISKVPFDEYEPGLLLFKESGGINSQIVDLKNIYFYSNNNISEILKIKQC